MELSRLDFRLLMDEAGLPRGKYFYVSIRGSCSQLQFSNNGGEFLVVLSSKRVILGIGGQTPHTWGRTTKI